MTRADSGERVLAVGIDAAEATYVRRLLAEGRMPVLAGLLRRGRWSSIQSPAAIGSGSVWPTFFTGTEPRIHGVYSEWLWNPRTMGMERYDPQTRTPFWSGLAARQLRVGLLDVPLAPFVGLEEGFEVSEWGPHDVLEGRTRAAPADIATLLSSGTEHHPYASDDVDAHGVADHDGLRAVADASLRGIEMRGGLAARLLAATAPDLAIIVFPEIHHASHLLWHTVAPEDPRFTGPEFAVAPPGPTMAELYEAVDRQVGRLVEVVGEAASVVVFALHGMRATRGIPTMLSGLLRADGRAQLATWRSQSPKERALSAFAEVKRRSPAWARALYKRSIGHSVRVNLARPTMLEPLDWSRTGAFALPTDQHGWLRVNLAGRERDGCVPAAGYDPLCRWLEDRLRRLVTADGGPVVADVLRTATGAEDAAGNPLPDVVVHWAPSAYDDPLQLPGDVPPSSPATPKLTGQHGSDGFCVAVGSVAARLGDVVKAEALHTALLAPLSGQGVGS